MTGPERSLIAAAALMAAAGVGLGAYGAHGLQVEPSLNRIWETATAYQMWHALGAIGAALLAGSLTGISARLATLARCGFLAGSVLFSGSLYWFVLDGIVPVPGAAPIGGVTMIAAWILLAAAAIKRA